MIPRGKLERGLLLVFALCSFAPLATIAILAARNEDLAPSPYLQIVDAIFLAGGSTHLPKVQEGVRIYFGKAGRFEVNPTEVIALGASQHP